MAQDEASRKLAKRVEVDDALLGGERHEHEGGKRGRSGPNKVPFVVAVATSDEGRPQRLLLHVVRTHDGEEIEKMAAAHLSSTARIVSDGLGCFRAVTRVGCTHEPVVAAKTGWSETIPAFKWVNTVLGNVKTAIRGTFEANRRAYVPRYFAEFQWRFNRRADLKGMLAADVNMNPRPYLALRLSDAGG